MAREVLREIKVQNASCHMRVVAKLQGDKTTVSCCRTRVVVKLQLYDPWIGARDAGEVTPKDDFDIDNGSSLDSELAHQDD